MAFTFSVVHPATGHHAWDITEGWSAALREMGCLRREFRPKAEWDSKYVESDDGLLDYLRSDPQEYFLLLGYDWHSQSLHYGEIHEKLGLRRKKNVAVIWEEYQVKEELLDGLAEKMRRAWIRCKSAFSLAISNHENNIQALARLSDGVAIEYIGFGVDDARFEHGSTDKESKVNRVYVSGKISDWSHDKEGGPYALRRKILTHLEKSTVDIVGIQCKQSDSDYTQNLISSTICLNLPSFSLSPMLRNYEALAAKSLLITWKSDSLKSLEELQGFPNVFPYDPFNLDEITSLCNDLLQIDQDEYRRLTSLGSQQIHRLTHKSRIQQLISLLSTESSPKISPPKQGPQVLVIDMVFLQVARTGIAYVWDSIIKAYLKKHSADSLVLLQRTDTLLSDYGCRVIKTHSVDWNQDPVELSEEIDSLLRENGVSSYSFASSYYTFSRSHPSLQIIHDMIPELLGGTEPVWAHKLASLNQSSALLCVSRSTRNDLLGFNREWSEKVHVHMNGMPTNHLYVAPQQNESISPSKDKLIESDFTMLTIGRRYGWKGYKNCGVVFRAFRKFLSRIPEGKTSKIICISHSNIPESQIQNLIKDLPVYFIGATDSELAMIREKTHCLLYPSAIEGFGLPILEAIYSGMNVITSDILPHREATGTFASQVQFVPPFDEDLYADAMYQFFCQRVSDANKLKNHASLQDKICRISEERWMSFADALASFALRPGSLRVKNVVYQHDLWLTAMEASFQHKKKSLPLRIASSWNGDRI